MSVDQTSQLIQLMLNSVLMMALCGSLAIGLIIRQRAIVSQLRLLKPLYEDAATGLRLFPPERFLQLKAQLRLLRRHYRLIRLACWSANSALVLCAGSTLLLALRTLVLLNRLIPLSLLLFTSGAALLLLGIVLGWLSLMELNFLEDKREPEPKPEFKPGRSRSLLQERETSSARLVLRATPKEPLPASLPMSNISTAQPASRSRPRHQLKPPKA